MSRASRNWPKAPSDVSEHLQLKGGFKKSLSILAKFYSAPVRLPRRALVDFRISGPWRSYGVNSTFPMNEMMGRGGFVEGKRLSDLPHGIPRE